MFSVHLFCIFVFLPVDHFQDAHKAQVIQLICFAANWKEVRKKMGSILHLQIIFGEKHNIYLLLHTRMNLEIKLVFLEKDEGVKLLRKLSQI